MCFSKFIQKVSVDICIVRQKKTKKAYKNKTHNNEMQSEKTKLDKAAMYYSMR